MKVYQDFVAIIVTKSIYIYIVTTDGNHGLLILCNVFRTVSAMVGWIKQTLSSEQRKADFKPEDDEEMQMNSKVSNHNILLLKKLARPCAGRKSMKRMRNDII